MYAFSDNTSLAFDLVDCQLVWCWFESSEYGNPKAQQQPWKRTKLFKETVKRVLKLYVYFMQQGSNRTFNSNEINQSMQFNAI